MYHVPAGSQDCSYSAWPDSWSEPKRLDGSQPLVHARGDAHVVPGERHLEGVHREIEPPAPEVVAERSAPFSGRRRAGPRSCRRAQDIDARRRSAGDGAHERQERVAQRGEERCERRHRLARLEAVHQRVAGVAALAMCSAISRFSAMVFSRRGANAATSRPRARRPDIVTDAASSARRGPARRNAPVIVNRLAHLRAHRALDVSGARRALGLGLVQHPRVSPATTKSRAMPTGGDLLRPCLGARPRASACARPRRGPTGRSAGR